MECASSDTNGLRNIHLQKRQQREDKTRSAMLDLDFLDCPICVEPFTIPIFQCDNGHLACASCCPKLSNKCPSCTFPVGHICCRAMENVLESILVPCRNSMFGCTKNLFYGKELTHQKECNFTPCSCPVQDCNYIGSYKDLYNHYESTHLKRFTFDYVCCGNSFIVGMKIIDEKILRMKKLLFAVQCFEEPCGVYVTVSCIAPPAPEVGEFSYHLSYTLDGHTMTYESPKLKRVLKVSSQRPEESFMLIPHSLLRGQWLNMKLCIKELKQA